MVTIPELLWVMENNAAERHAKELPRTTEHQLRLEIINLWLGQLGPFSPQFSAACLKERRRPEVGIAYRKVLKDWEKRKGLKLLEVAMRFKNSNSEGEGLRELEGRT